MVDNKCFRSKYVLGIDVGTTSVKCTVLDLSSGRVVQTLSKETKASVVSDFGPLAHEQDVHRICLALQSIVSRVPREVQARTVRVGVCGQMHGLVLWKCGEAWHQNQFGRFEIGDKCRVLFTWQDARCTPDFLATLPKPQSHLRLCTGHACATIFWLMKHRPEYLANYDCAGTIQDFVVAMLCNLDRPLMSAQNAASWGYFDTVSKSWNVEILREHHFPLHLLPSIVDNGQTVGCFRTPWYLIPEGTEVEVALGDMQCSVYSTLHHENDAVLNISTSAQMSFMMPESFCPIGDSSSPETIQYFPYFNSRYLAVAASLNGGNVLAAFVRLLQQWTHELGLGVPEDKIWEKLLAAADDDATAESDLMVVPTLFGERHLPDQRASVCNIDANNTSLGKVGRGLYKGIIRNMTEMMAPERLLANNICRIVGTGSALTRNAVLKKELERQYNLPVVYTADACDAACGAARHARASVQRLTVENQSPVD